jgi:N,N-dimethylformamidase beta subunit-like protein
LLEKLAVTEPFFAFISIFIAIVIIIGISDSGIAFASTLPSSNDQSTGQAQLAVKIIDPFRGATIPSRLITVNGSATTFGSGNTIQKVEAVAHTYPFPKNFNFIPANPVSEGNWSSWSMQIPINSTGFYRILAHITDDQGNENWTETNVNVPFFSDAGVQSNIKSSALQQLKRIAIVVPTFTETAYSTHSFYTFYDKYKTVSGQQQVKTDLDMLNPPIVQRDITITPNQTLGEANVSSFSIADPNDQYITSLATHLQKAVPHSLITIIRDEDIHNGYIFTPSNSTSDDKNTNAYDMLIVTHDEYATQDMYDNYKRFVSNGGTLLALDGNIFYAQIKYNKDNNTITFVKGHGWEFDGNSAKRSIRERWFNENSQWLGSNFLESELTENITFSNNPFNYTHFEENFVNNPKDKILIDYDAVAPRNNPFLGSTVATYELDFGKGKVVMMGLYGQNLIRNEAFLRFLDSLILKYM